MSQQGSKTTLPFLTPLADFRQVLQRHLLPVECYRLSIQHSYFRIGITLDNGFNIGLFQCIAMIPGVSRSMATIVGGMAQKLTRKDAAEFSFFLAVPTMFAATGYKVLKLFLDGGTEILLNNMPALIIGNVVAFIVALLAIKFFISFVTKYGFKAFGWYRIIVGGTILVMLLLGYNLEIG